MAKLIVTLGYGNGGLFVWQSVRWVSGCKGIQGASNPHGGAVLHAGVLPPSYSSCSRHVQELRVKLGVDSVSQA